MLQYPAAEISPVQGKEQARQEKVDEEDQVMQKVKKKPRVASYDMLLAMEHVLDAIGDHQLESFLPKDKTDEESKVSILDAPTLVTLTDCGSDCFCPMWFALSHLKMRLWHFPDPRHRLVREQANAAQHSGLRGCLALSDVILQFFLGPWEEHKWWQVVKEETSQYLNMARLAAKAGENHEGNALIRHLLPKIAQEQGWVENETTVERVHEALSEALFLRRRGASGNSSRWNEFHWSFGERRKEFSLLLLILVSYGINMGYVQQADAPVLTSLQTQAQRASNRASEAKTLKEAKQSSSVTRKESHKFTYLPDFFQTDSVLSCFLSKKQCIPRRCPHGSCNFLSLQIRFLGPWWCLLKTGKFFQALQYLLCMSESL